MTTETTPPRTLRAGFEEAGRAVMIVLLVMTSAAGLAVAAGAPWMLPAAIPVAASATARLPAGSRFRAFVGLVAAMGFTWWLASLVPAPGGPGAASALVQGAALLCPGIVGAGLIGFWVARASRT